MEGFIHHLIATRHEWDIGIGWTKLSRWGFQLVRRWNWRGLIWRRPNWTKSAAALSDPNMDKNSRAVMNWTCRTRNRRTRILLTLSSGTLTMPMWVRNLIPAYTKSWDGTRSDFRGFGIRPRLVMTSQASERSDSRDSCERRWTSQSSKYWWMFGPRDRICPATISIKFVKTKSAVEIPNGSARNWYIVPSRENLRYLRDAGWIGIWRYASIKSLETAQAPGGIALRMEAAVSIWKWSTFIILLSDDRSIMRRKTAGFLLH